MHNRDLAKDYIKRAEIRLSAVAVLFQMESWADVMRESQELIELALRAFLRSHGVEVPRVHDVPKIIEQESQRLPGGLDLRRLAAISKDLRRDREIAFYGSEDLTPSEFYSEEDAVRAFDSARYVVSEVKPYVK